MYEDEPSDRVHDVLADAIYGDHPLGRRVLGTAEVIGSIPIPDISAYHRDRYRGSNLVVSAAGQPRARADRRAGRATTFSPATGEVERRRTGPSRPATRGSASTRRRPSSTTSASALRGSPATTTAASPSASWTPSSAARPPRGCSARCARSAASPTPSAPTPSSSPTAAPSPCTSAPARTTSPRPARSSAASSSRCATEGVSAGRARPRQGARQGPHGPLARVDVRADVAKRPLGALRPAAALASTS